MIESECSKKGNLYDIIFSSILSCLLLIIFILIFYINK